MHNERTPLLQAKQKSEWQIRKEAMRHLQSEIHRCIQDVRASREMPKLALTCAIAIPLLLTLTMVGLYTWKQIAYKQFCRGNILDSYNFGNGTWPDNSLPYNGIAPTNYTCGQENKLSTICMDGLPYTIQDCCTQAGYQAYRYVTTYNETLEHAMTYYNDSYCGDDVFCKDAYPLTNISNWIKPLGYIGFVCLTAASDLIFSHDYYWQAEDRTDTLIAYLAFLIVGAIFTAIVGIAGFSSYKGRQTVSDLPSETKDKVKGIGIKLNNEIPDEMKLDELIKFLKKQEVEIYNPLRRDLIFSISGRDTLLNKIVATNVALGMRILQYAGLFRDPVSVNRQQNLPEAQPAEEIIDPAAGVGLV